MKAIINMDELLKKNTLKLEVTAADNEDLTSKLQVSAGTRTVILSIRRTVIF